jgi:hypothetical protein
MPDRDKPKGIENVDSDALETVEQSDPVIAAIVNKVKKYNDEIFGDLYTLSTIPEGPKQQIDQEIKREIPNLPTSTRGGAIADFISSYIEANKGKSIAVEDIMKAFFDQQLPEQMYAQHQEVLKAMEENDIDKIINEIDLKEIKDAVYSIMSELGLSEEQLSELQETEIFIVYSMQNSHANSRSEVVISAVQCVRGAMEHQQIYGSKVPLREVVKAFMIETIAHELGHKADLVTLDPYDDRPKEISSMVTDNEVSAVESFAEFIATHTMQKLNKDTYYSRRIFLYGASSQHRFWDNIKQYNQTHEEKIDVSVLHSALDELLQKQGDEVAYHALDMLWNNDLQGTNKAVDYLFPLSEQEVQQSVKKLVA